MSRIRSIKPEAFESESLAKVSVSAERTYFGLSTLADDRGRFIDKPAQINGNLWAMRGNHTAAELDQELEELVKADELVCRYVGCDGRRYLHAPRWDRHQKIDKPGAPRYPRCPHHPVSVITGVPELCSIHKGEGCPVPEDSQLTLFPGVLPESSPSPPETPASPPRNVESDPGALDLGSRTRDLGSRTVPPTAGAEQAAPPKKPPRHAVADELAKAFWEQRRNPTAQKFLAIRGVIRTAIANGLPRDDVARALGLLDREARAVSGGTLTTALHQLRSGHGARASPYAPASAAEQRTAEVAHLREVDRLQREGHQNVIEGRVIA